MIALPSMRWRAARPTRLGQDSGSTTCCPCSSSLFNPVHPIHIHTHLLSPPVLRMRWFCRRRSCLDRFDSAVHPEKEIYIALIGSSGSGKASFIHKLVGPLYRLRRSTRRITAIKVNVGGRNVVLLDTPDIGALVNGREVVEREVFNPVKNWLQKPR